jgi:hypothetical protein
MELGGPAGPVLGLLGNYLPRVLWKPSDNAPYRVTSEKPTCQDLSGQPAHTFVRVANNLPRAAPGNWTVGRDAAECWEARYESLVQMSDCFRSRTITHALTGQIWFYHSRSQSADSGLEARVHWFSRNRRPVRCSLMNGQLALERFT